MPRALRLAHSSPSGRSSLQITEVLGTEGNSLSENGSELA